MENLNEFHIKEIDNSLNKLYNFFSSERSKCQPHSSRAIYFCSEEKCSRFYVCSECLIEEPSHFAEHYKYLVPIDEKKKFFKFLKFPVDEIVLKLSSQDDKMDINKAYDDIKDLIMKTIEQHKEKYYDQFHDQLKEKMSNTVDVGESAELIDKKISGFIKENNKHQIQKFISELKDELKHLISAHSPQGKIDLLDIEMKINDILTQNLNRVCGVENKHSSLIKFEETKKTFEEAISSQSPKVKEELETIQEVIETDPSVQGEEQSNHSQNIKNRLDLLKKKIDQLK